MKNHTLIIAMTSSSSKKKRGKERKAAKAAAKEAKDRAVAARAADAETLLHYSSEELSPSCIADSVRMGDKLITTKLATSGIAGLSLERSGVLSIA